MNLDEQAELDALPRKGKQKLRRKTQIVHEHCLRIGWNECIKSILSRPPSSRIHILGKEVGQIHILSNYDIERMMLEAPKKERKKC